MAEFDQAFDITLGIEKGFVNNPLDPGGSTKYGITEKTARRGGYMGLMEDLPIDMAKRIAKAFYWDVAQCDQYDQRIAFQIFDAIYNGGRPIQWSQQACGIEADGKLGPITIAAIKAADPHQFVLKFLSYRLSYLTSLKTWPTFGRGWSNRIAANLLTGAA